MPRTYAKKRAIRGRKATSRPAKRGRRLSGMYLPAYNGNPELSNYDWTKKYRSQATAMPTAARRRVRGSHARRSGRPAVDAASGATGAGFTAGKAKRMGKILMNRKKRIMSVLADARYPVIKDHRLDATTQIDWVAGFQACEIYNVGYSTSEIQDMLTQANSAGSVLTSSLVVPIVNTNINGRMDFYSKKTKLNMKNSSSHTVYVEIQAYNCKGYHSFSLLDSWQKAMATDDMNQNAASFGTEQGAFNIGNRPDMRLADLNVRWSRDRKATYKIALEPGQETSYTYIQPGGRFDQNKFNVLTGSTGTPVDAIYGPFTTQMLVFARAEMVADRADNDVTYGSGHIACNIERWKSWSAVPYIKPFQASFGNNWGTVVEADEEDINQYDAQVDPYIERV